MADRQSGHFPLRETVLQPAYPITALARQSDCHEREHAPRAGSVCGRRLSGKPSSTIGFERRHNAAFRIDPADEFVEFMLQDIPPPPVGAAELRAWNSGRHAAAAE